MNKIENILIIGNGFDRFKMEMCELNYYDFVKSIPIENTNPLISHFKNHRDDKGNFLWSDMEKELGLIVSETLENVESFLQTYSLTKQTALSLNDNKLTNYIIENENLDDPNYLKNVTNRINLFILELQTLLKCYINNVLAKQKDIKSKVAKYIKKLNEMGTLITHDNTLVINFNYTTYLEYFFNHNNIFHLHGTLNTPGIIFNSAQLNEKYWTNERYNILSKQNKDINDHIKNQNENCINKIKSLKTLKSLIIVGHSIMESDIGEKNSTIPKGIFDNLEVAALIPPSSSDPKVIVDNGPDKLIPQQTALISNLFHTKYDDEKGMTYNKSLKERFILTECTQS